MSEKKHPIIFCGAGPGDPELITVKGKNALKNADMVLYAGSLVPEAVTEWAPGQARRINSAGMDLEQMMHTMTDAYHQGFRVVRLHTGDPSLYGAIGEQIAQLQLRRIAYLVIPGVTAAFAGAAALGIEYTVPEMTQTLILTRMAGRTPVPESEKLEILARIGASMVIYLSMALIEDVARVLADSYGPEAKCVIAYRVSHPQEKIIKTQVGQLVKAAQSNDIKRLAVIMVGPGMDHPNTISAHRSKLYDKEFSHGYRSAR